MTQYQIEAKIYLFSPKIFFSLMILLPNFFHDLSIPRCISYNTNQTTKIAWQIWCTVLLVSQSIVPHPEYCTMWLCIGTIWRWIIWTSEQKETEISVFRQSTRNTTNWQTPLPCIYSGSAQQQQHFRFDSDYTDYLSIYYLYF